MLILIPTHLKADVNPENPIHLGCKDSRSRVHPDNFINGVDIREEVVIGDDAFNVGVCLDCTVSHFVPEVFRGLVDYVWELQQSLTGKKIENLLRTSSMKMPISVCSKGVFRVIGSEKALSPFSVIILQQKNIELRLVKSP